MLHNHKYEYDRVRLSQQLWLTTAELADYLALSKGHLEAFRRRREGPPWRQRGRIVRYYRPEVDEWLLSNTPNGR